MSLFPASPMCGSREENGEEYEGTYPNCIKKGASGTSASVPDSGPTFDAIDPESPWESFQNFVIGTNRANSTYLLLFLAITVFPIFTRGLGLIGVIRALGNPRCHAHLAFYILVIALLLALYGLHGWSRFRVPLEPILMVFTAISLSKLKSKTLT